MTKVQILENENFIEKADFENCEVWLLNKTTEEEIDERIINISELTESLEPSALKLPKLLTAIYEKYPTIESFNENGELISAELGFDYEILTDNKENYAINTYVCDVEKIKIMM